VVKCRFVRLISGSHGELPEGLRVSPEELRYLRDRRGEKIAVFDEQDGALLGTASLFPERDEGGHFFRLAGLDVASGPGRHEAAAALLGEARRFMAERRLSRLKLGTSPLLTDNAELYITRLGARYRWREGIRTPDGLPCPYVSCECDFDDPAARPLDLTEEEVAPRSVLAWDGPRPRPLQRVVYSGPLSVLLPAMDAEDLAAGGARDPELLPVLWAVFHSLSVHGYGFAWFDRREACPPGEPPFYYVMKRVVAL
jgi:hypothetical protein